MDRALLLFIPVSIAEMPANWPALPLCLRSLISRPSLKTGDRFERLRGWHAVRVLNVSVRAAIMEGRVCAIFGSLHEATSSLGRRA